MTPIIFIHQINEENIDVYHLSISISDLGVLRHYPAHFHLIEDVSHNRKHWSVRWST